jgi:hypothetical protein
MVSPIIVELIEVGLRHWESEKSSEGDSVGLVPDTVQGNQLDIETIKGELKGELLGELRGELQTLADSIAEKK